MLHRLEDLAQWFIRVASTPAERPAEVVTGAQGEDPHGGLDVVLLQLVQAGEDPAHGPVPATGQQPHTRHFLVQLYGWLGSTLTEVKNLRQDWCNFKLRFLDLIDTYVSF